MSRFLTLALLFVLVACEQGQQTSSSINKPNNDVLPVDTLYHNGTIWTGLSGAGDAQMLATKAGKIVYVGDGSGVQFKATRSVDLKGQFMSPGFIDNHVHFIDGGAGLASVDLRDANTREEFVRRIGDYSQTLPEGRWVLYGNWDHELWGGELPTRHWIDAVTGDTPVFVMRLDWHMGLANSAALKLAGIDKNSTAPADGEIVRDAEGEPSGVLKDGAMNAVLDVIPARTDDEFLAAFVAAQNHALSLGVVQVHAMPANPKERTLLPALQKVQAAGAFKMRVYAMSPIEYWEELAAKIATEGTHKGKLRWGGVKGFVDGALGSSTAWFYDPYDDQPSNSGFPLTQPERLRALITAADDAGLKLNIHAIGDRAIDELITAFRETGGHATLAHRFRIEHFQHPSEQAIALAARSGIIAAMQPYHAIDDGRWAEKRIGEARSKTTYAFRSILDSGGLLSFGSDWPVAPLSPIEGIYAAVTRQTTDGAKPAGWQPQQKITVTEALRAYTSVNAYAGFEENQAGTLEVGKRADLVILSDDPRKVAPDAIRTIEVVTTIVDGDVVYEHE
ncbi:amidohydrolase [Arenicella chitinivorans]|uniref:Amidohydrolase n=1 Tax=Arenicella chitinivorans TaxID=1329800 RepID=A0A918VIC3_9GAMM|nr:amidohydrolase [Arenicella chitinivorans]GHA01127.1 amidohydrolase [Arenicella chitinivorans]